jgi:alpha-beta hydrolase superfamily lysophospholipase
VKLHGALTPSFLGNPGLAEFYIPFLTILQEGCYKSGLRGLAIIAKSHLGHSPSLPDGAPKSNSLFAQVAAIEEICDAIHREYPDCKLILASHSIGSWITMQVAEASILPQLI